MPTEAAIADPRTDLVPLTDAQSGVWFTEQAGDNHSAYHVALRVDLHGELDAAALDRAVAAVVARHPVLAAGVEVADGRPHLRPGRHAIGVRRLDADAGTLAHAVARCVAAPFPLGASGPLARFALLRVAARHHVLVISAHHLVFDGQSKDIVLHDLADAYGGGAVAAPPDYARAVRAELARTREQAAAALEHWAGWVPDGELRLPGTRLPGPAAGEHLAVPARPAVGERVEVPATRTGLDAAARDAGCTRFELLLAAVHVLLHRYGNETPSVAVDVATRTPESADVVGMFVNELPVAVRPRPGMPFAEFAAAVRAQLRRAYPLRASPVARAARVRPGTSLGPVSVSYRRQGPAPRFAGLQAEVDWAPAGVAPRSPIHLHVTDLDAGPQIWLIFDPRAVDRATATAVAEHLANLLDQAVRAPRTPIGRLNPCGAGELRRLRAWLTGPTAEPDATLAGLLHDATTDLGSDALIAADGRLSHADLHRAADRLAHRLAGLGIGPGRLVGLCAPPGVAAMVGMLAVLKAGAAYLPLDPGHPPARTAFVVADARPALVLHAAGARPALSLAIPTLPIDVDPGPVPPPGGEPARPGPLDPAYVIYTSGSTGRPKGVTVTQRAIVNLLRSMRDEIGARPGDRWLWLTPLTFDISTVESLLPMVTGGAVVVPGEGAARDGAALARIVREHGVTHAQTTPSRWELVLAAGDEPAGEPAWAGVTALCGGEPLAPALAERLLARVARLYNVYGPTETTVWSTIAAVSAADDVTIGRPLAGTSAYVLDADLSAVPAGVDGRLCLAGVGLASHYHGRAALTAQRFLPDPFGPPGSRLYVTGDNARVDRDGALVCLGRDDLQVKIRGHRVELGEIEARLLDLPAVAAAAVVLDGRRLIAYLAGDRVPGRAELTAHLSAHVPAHMVPAAYVVLDRLPLTPHGKVDRAALPEHRPEPGEPAPAATPAAGDELVEQVRAIWSEALQSDEVGLDDDLFDLGGHSLTITRIAARVRDRFGVDIPLHELWDAPTVAQAAAAIRAATAR